MCVDRKQKESRMAFSNFITGKSGKVDYIKTIIFTFVLVILVSHECEAKKRYKIVVLPFRDYAQMNMGEMVPGVLRSTFTQTGYFEPLDREIIYEKATALIPGDMIKLDNVTKGADGSWTTDQVDLLSRLDTKIVKRFGRQLKADYVLKGVVSLMGDILRIDVEIIGIKEKKILGSVTSEGNLEELSFGILEALSDKITSFCRNLNAYDDALSIIGLYNQGQYTFDVSEKKLREILSITHDSVGIRASLIVLYLSRIHKEEDALLENEVVEEGVKILLHLDEEFDEKVLGVFSTSGIDPFDEIAKIFAKKDENEKAIEVYEKALSVYPINNADYYKELGFLYLKSGLVDKAVDAFKKSLDVNRCSYEVNFALVSIFEKRNNPEKALKHLGECMRYARNVGEIEAAKKKIAALSP